MNDDIGKLSPELKRKFRQLLTATPSVLHELWIDFLAKFGAEMARQGWEAKEKELNETA